MQCNSIDNEHLTIQSIHCISAGGSKMNENEVKDNHAEACAQCISAWFCSMRNSTARDFESEKRQERENERMERQTGAFWLQNCCCWCSCVHRNKREIECGANEMLFSFSFSFHFVRFYFHRSSRRRRSQMKNMTKTFCRRNTTQSPITIYI